MTILTEKDKLVAGIKNEVCLATTLNGVMDDIVYSGANHTIVMTISPPHCHLLHNLVPLAYIAWQSI